MERLAAVLIFIAVLAMAAEPERPAEAARPKFPAGPAAEIKKPKKLRRPRVAQTVQPDEARRWYGGRVRFLRLNHEGEDWDYGMAAGADANLLSGFWKRTRIICEERPESIKIQDLAKFPRDQAPPFVYLTGRKSIKVSANDVVILRNYLLDRGGLLLADNGGGHFHVSFRDLLRQMLPTRRLTEIPKGDELYNCNYEVPLASSPDHRPPLPQGIKHRGRWIVVYHPGSLCEAWADGHGGASEEVVEVAYQLGVNVMYYSLLSHARHWNRSGGTFARVVNLNLGGQPKLAGGASGFSGCWFDSKARFVRIKYTGGDWDQDIKEGAGKNLLKEFHKRTKIPCRDRADYLEIPALADFLLNQSPPFAYLTGSKGINISDKEVEILRDYLLDRGGLLLIDNGGGFFHDPVLHLVKKMLPRKPWIDIPDDDEIYNSFYILPNGAPPLRHYSGTRALGIKHKGRWVVFYHQGDLGDAWKDGHAGTSRENVELAYRLGVNIIYYSYVKYLECLEASGKPERKKQPVKRTDDLPPELWEDLRDGRLEK